MLPAFTCCAFRVVRCVRHQPSFSATVGDCTFFHVLPHLEVLCVVCSPLTSLSWSAGRTSTCLSRRSSELTLLDTHLHVLRADCWCPAPLSPPPHVARGVVEFMSHVFSREDTPSTGITSSGLAVSEVRKLNQIAALFLSRGHSATAWSAGSTAEQINFQIIHRIAKNSLSPNYRPPAPQCVT